MKNIRRTISLTVLAAFVSTLIQHPSYAQSAVQTTMPWMPKPGVIVNLSPEFTPAHLKGMVIHPDNALQFDFIMHRGDSNFSGEEKKAEYDKLIKYFLASLAVPDENQWVNLSPYEKDRIIKDDFGKTEMGRDLLSQDYILKQITASLIYPESNLGQKFWDKVYSQAQQQYGTTNIPMNTFNKVWIVPDEALIYEKGNTVYIVKQHLKVMLEQDYLSLSKHEGIASAPKEVNKIGSQVVREIVLPALEKEVNEGKNFAPLRQVYSGMLLAAWYKRSLKESLLGKIYADKSKVKGIDQDPKANQEIYQQYLKAFKKGVFNYIKEDVDKYSKQAIPRKYFSGGLVASGTVYTSIKREASAAMVTADAAQIGDGRLEAVRANLARTRSGTRSEIKEKPPLPTTGQPLKKIRRDAAMSVLSDSVPKLGTVNPNSFLTNLEYAVGTKSHLKSHHALLDELVGILTVQNFQGSKSQDIYDFFKWAVEQGYLTEEDNGVVDATDFKDLLGRDTNELLKELLDNSFIDEKGNVLIELNRLIPLGDKFQDKGNEILGILLGKARFRISPNFQSFSEEDRRHAGGIESPVINLIESAFKSAVSKAKVMSPYEDVLRFFINGHDSGYTMKITDPIYKDDLIKTWKMIARVNLESQFVPEELAQQAIEIDRQATELANQTYELMMNYSNKDPQFMQEQEERLTKEYMVFKEGASEDERRIANDNARKKAITVLQKSEFFLTKILGHGTSSIVLVKRTLVAAGLSEDQSFGLAFLFASHHPGYPISFVHDFAIPKIVPKELAPVLLINSLDNDPDKLRLEIAKRGLQLLGISPSQGDVYVKALAIAALGFANDRTTPARRFGRVYLEDVRVENGELKGTVTFIEGETNKKYPLIITNIFDRDGFTIGNVFTLTINNLRREAEAAIATLKYFKNKTNNQTEFFDELIRIYEQQTELEIGRTQEVQAKILELISPTGRLGENEQFSTSLENILKTIDLTLQEYNSMSLSDPDRDAVGYLLGFLISIYQSPDAMNHMKSAFAGNDVKKLAQGLMPILGQHFDNPTEFEAFLKNFGTKIKTVAFPRGRIIFQQGDDNVDGMYWVTKGQVKIEVNRGGDLGPQVIAFRGEGPLGEMAILDGSPRTATVTASDEVTAYFIPREAIEELGAEKPEFMDILRRIQAQRLQNEKEVLDSNPIRTGFQSMLRNTVSLWRVSDGPITLGRELPRGLRILEAKDIEKQSAYAAPGGTFEVVANALGGEEKAMRLLKVGDGLEATNDYGGAFYLKPKEPGGIAGYVELETGEIIPIYGFDLVGEGAVLELINGGTVPVADPKRKATVYILEGTSILGVSVEVFRDAYIKDETFRTGVTEKYTVRFEYAKTPLADFLRTYQVTKNFPDGHPTLNPNPFKRLGDEEIAARLKQARAFITGRSNNKATEKLLKHYLNAGANSRAHFDVSNTRVGILSLLTGVKGDVLKALSLPDSPWVTAIERELDSFYDITPNVSERLTWFFERMDLLVKERLITGFYAGLRMAMISTIIPNHTELGLDDIINAQVEKYKRYTLADELKRIKGPTDAAQRSEEPVKAQADAATLSDNLKGGIDLNSANLNLQIKRDGKGIPLPFSQQDLNLLNSIEGLVPIILDIKPASLLPVFSELKSSKQIVTG